MKKKALIVIDMVNGFRKEGNMAFCDGEYIEPEIEKLIVEFLNNGDDVISIQENHHNDSVEFNDFPKHCIGDTDEAMLVDVLKKYEDRMIVIRKNSTCGYVTNEFQNYLSSNAEVLNEIVMTGVCLDICVMNMAIPTKMYMNEHDINCDVIVPMNAVETFDSDTHSRDEYKTLSKKMLKLNGIKVVKNYGGNYE